jgi:hypothetical protein
LESISEAKERLLILDGFFDVEWGLDIVWPAFLVSQIVDARILLEKKEDQKKLNEYLKEKKDVGELNQMNCSFRVRRHLGNVHDRFAVVDDELWHFGSTVGGAHQAFSAVSRGWSSEEFCDVYESIWKDAND